MLSNRLKAAASAAVNSPESRLGARKSLVAAPDVLKEARMEEIRMAFDYFDTNRDNALSKREVKQLLNSFGIPPEDEETVLCMQEITTSDHFKFSFEHVVLMVGILAPRKTSFNAAMKAFKALDLEGTGICNTDSAETVLKSCVRSLSFPLSEAEVSDVLAQFETTKGSLDYVALVNSLIA